jgi:PAS domain S-box-containing protein
MSEPALKQTDVLVVDDREDGLTALEAVLGGGSLNVVRAQSGREALSLLDSHDFAVILLDVQMPEMDGFETAARIKQMDAHRMRPIIFVTAINKDDAYVYKGYEQGAVDYLFKPFDSRILKSKVSVFVELHKKTRLLEAQAEQIQESERRERYLRLAALEVESLKRYRNLADAIPHSVWRAKADGTMDYFNHVWTETTGLTSEQSSGIGWQSVFNPRGLRELLRTWMNAMETGQPFQLECQIRSPEGDWRWHWIRGVPEKRAGGEIIAWLGTCTDIQDRKETEDSLIVARKDAEAASNAKTQFLANMSHEIRTPLNAILGFAELMAQDNLEGESHDSLVTIQRNGRQLLNIIDEILDISKVEANRLELEEVEVDLRTIITDVYSLLSVQAKEKNLVLTADCKTLIPKRLRTDPTRLRQILINIVGNAIKFTSEGSVHIDMAWSKEAGVDQGLLKFVITDTGVGIDSTSAARLFQPFTQADSSTTRKFGGTGLGLALSRKLAIALGGDVRLESSTKGKGSVFTVEIRSPHVEGFETWSDFNDAVVSEGTAAAANAMVMKAKLSSEGFLSGMNILVVDDAGDNRTLISRFLVAAGAKVDCAVDGFDGMDRALNKNYDVVLMDIQMPQLDGYSATTQLRAGGYLKPIIALTAHALKEERENSLKAGCNDHLTKPIDRTTLIDSVAKFGGRVLL